MWLPQYLGSVHLWVHGVLGEARREAGEGSAGGEAGVAVVERSVLSWAAGQGFPGSASGNRSRLPLQETGGDVIPGSGRSPSEGRGNPLQRSCLGNPMDRGAWWAPVRGVAKSWM